MITVYHISDLHIGTPGEYDSHNARVKNLLDQLHAVITKDPGFKVISITGDLTDAGDYDQYALIADFLQKFKQVNSLAIRVIPGNHDIGGVRGTLFDRRCAKRFDDLTENIKMPCTFSAKYSETYPGFSPFYETVQDGDGNNVLLVYLNSCSKKQLSDFSQGTLGAYQLLKLDEILSDHKHKDMPSVVCLHHKPLNKALFGFVMDLDEGDRFTLKYLMHKHKIKAFLYGHQDEKDDDDHDGVITEQLEGSQSCYLVDGNFTVKSFGYYVMEVKDGVAGKPAFIKLREK